MSRAVAFTLALVMCMTLPDAGAGEAAADKPPSAFTLPGLDGKPHQLAEWKNKVVLLNFWASWCSPCQSEIRDLVAYQNQYGADGLQIVGIGLDDEAKLRNVHRSLEINYPVLLANTPDNTLMSRYGNTQGVVPFSVLIARNGEVVYTHTGLISREMFAEEVIPRLR
ncbi:MAG: TlpA family protein disulfide reductase [Nitrosomonadales bacterium]|nr:TlpA family protein disulfide reductase [Nitrosomonadales bacterium]